MERVALSRACVRAPHDSRRCVFAEMGGGEGEGRAPVGVSMRGLGDFSLPTPGGCGGVSRLGYVCTCVRACVLSARWDCISAGRLRLRPGLCLGLESGCWRRLHRVPTPGCQDASGGGVQPPEGVNASTRSLPLPAPSWPGLPRAWPAWEGPGVCVLGGMRWGRPGPRAGRELGGPARLTSGDSLNRAGSALGSAFR